MKSNIISQDMLREPYFPDIGEVFNEDFIRAPILHREMTVQLKPLSTMTCWGGFFTFPPIKRMTLVLHNAEPWDYEPSIQRKEVEVEFYESIHLRIGRVIQNVRIYSEFHSYQIPKVMVTVRIEPSTYILQEIFRDDPI